MTHAAELVETWEINHRVNEKILDWLPEEALEVRSRPRARSVGDNLAHMHTVRVMHLEKRWPKLRGDLQKVAKGEHGDIANLRGMMEGSAARISDALREACDAGKVRSWKRGVPSFLGYLLSHEAHHRGQILLMLKLGGVKAPKDFGYSIWDWPRI